jgi:DNA-binding IclR family transcriptional regulator
VRRYQVRSVSRALDILGVFSESRPELSLAEVSVRVGLDKATVFRLLRSMEEHGYVAVDAKRSHYKLGPRVLQLAQVYLAGWSLRSAALPVMRRLRDEFNETVRRAG